MERDDRVLNTGAGHGCWTHGSSNRSPQGVGTVQEPPRKVEPGADPQTKRQKYHQILRPSFTEVSGGG